MPNARQIHISEGEWKLMNQLWDRAPRTIMQLTRQLEAETGWSKNTIITMLNRLEAKGAVAYEAKDRAKHYFPAIDKSDVALEETRGFLNRVYDGSLSLMVDAMAASQALSKKDIDELYEILKKAEEGVR